MSCCMQRFRYVFNSDGLALTVVANCICNFLIESHVHLRSILQCMYNSYGLMKDDGGMGIDTVTVKDNTCKPRASSPCLS